LHLGPYKKEKFVQKICQKLAEQKPDLVLLGGDLIAAPGSSKRKKDYTPYLTALSCISKNYPTYAVMGNHEYNIGNPYDFKNYYNQADKIRKILEENNIKILDNQAELFPKQDHAFWLIGVDEVWAAKSHLKTALKNTDNNHPKILLTHNPDIFHDIKKEDQISLTLCGHTHAGQIQLPLIGSLVEPPSDLGRKCYQGFCQLENTTVFITRGIGETGPRARLFAPPEIAILELRF
jgi:predicted MPP superfamily phosphohydrolase